MVQVQVITLVTAVAISGNSAIVGAYREDDAGGIIQVKHIYLM